MSSLQRSENFNWRRAELSAPMAAGSVLKTNLAQVFQRANRSKDFIRAKSLA